MKKRLSELIDHQFHIPKPEKIYSIGDLYNLIDSYEKGEIDETTFENKLYSHYTKHRSKVTLPEKVREIFYELSETIARFSPYKEDHQLAPNAFLTTEEVRNEILNAKKKLDKLCEKDT